MRKLILAFAVTASAIPFVAPPAQAQGYREMQERRECSRELRSTYGTRAYYRELRECRREIAAARRQDWRSYNRYDWNKPAPTGYYYANEYYRDGRYYRVRPLSRYDRIYRGSDGTTGLIIGAGVGALIGNSLDNGRSSVLGTLIGGAAGAAIGREIDRGQVRCR